MGFITITLPKLRGGNTPAPALTSVKGQYRSVQIIRSERRFRLWRASYGLIVFLGPSEAKLSSARKSPITTGFARKPPHGATATEGSKFSLLAVCLQTSGLRVLVRRFQVADFESLSERKPTHFAEMSRGSGSDRGPTQALIGRRFFESLGAELRESIASPRSEAGSSIIPGSHADTAAPWGSDWGQRNRIAE
jgi:hypothetical protein